jgi:hypothetical protein
LTHCSAWDKKYDYSYEDIVDIIPGARFSKIIVEGKNIYVNAKSNQYRYFQEFASKKRGIVKTETPMSFIPFPVMREPKYEMANYIIRLLLFSFLLYCFIKANEFSPTDPVSIITIILVCGQILLPIVGIISYLNTATYINKKATTNRQKRRNYGNSKTRKRNASGFSLLLLLLILWQRQFFRH